MAQYEDLVVGKLTVAGNKGADAASGVLEAVTGLSVLHKQAGSVVQSIFTLTDVAQTVVNGTEYQSTKLFTFPAGRILVLGTTASLAQKTTSAIATTLNSGVTGALAVGSAAASNVALTSTMVDLLPSTAFVTSTTINVAAAAVGAALAASAQFNGTTTAIPMYLNSAYASTLDVDADATQTWTGRIVVTWINLGDY